MVTSATKSNASRFGYVLWDEVAEDVAAEFPGVAYERVLVDALAARMVRDPGSLDVVVASNLFGDILTDLAAAIQGGMGMAASANVAPGSGAPGRVRARARLGARHRRAAGSRTRPARSGARSLMLDHLGEPEASRALMAALEDVCRDGPRTRDVGGDGVDARGRRGGRRPRGRAQRTIPMIAPPATTSSAGGDEPWADPLAVPPDHERGEEHGPERLRRVQRSDDRHAAAVEGPSRLE